MYVFEDCESTLVRGNPMALWGKYLLTSISYIMYEEFRSGSVPDAVLSDIGDRYGYIGQGRIQRAYG